MGASIRIIETPNHITIVESEFLKWINNKDHTFWKDELGYQLNIEDERVKAQIHDIIISFNETHYIHNEGSAGPLPLQLVMEAYIESLGFKMYSIEVYTDDVLTIQSPGINDPDFAN